MADYTASCRTNYFKVKDLDALRTDLLDHGITPRQWENVVGEGDLVLSEGGGQNKGSIALFSYGGWPGMDEDTVAMRLGIEDGDEPSAIESKYESIFGLVAAHLTDDSVAIFMEVGSERMRYLFGQSIAINAKGEMRTINLEDIMDIAQGLLPAGSTATISRAIY